MREEIIRITRACGAGFDTPAGRAWSAFLRAHADLTRLHDLEMRREVELSLSDFDVLMQLALAQPTCLRMSDLARRTLVSRSGMTRRVEQLEQRGLVQRAPAGTDRRSVQVTLMPPGADLLRRALPVHARGVAEHFVAKLTDEEADVLRRAMEKISPDLTPG